LENVYLIAGVRGDFQPWTQRIPVSVEVALSHTLDRWGISPLPWGACDSGADLKSAGVDVLRAWNHVDLRLSADDLPPQDVPLSGLLRSTWDALELFGTIVLGGVDAIVPLACAADPMWRRVAGSVLRDGDRISRRPPRVLVQAGTAWPTSPAPEWDADAILETLSVLVELHGIMDAIDRAPYPPSPIAHPFASQNADAFRAEVALPEWTIDDAAWLAEALCASCYRAGLTDDIQIAVRLIGA
jgi:hypothetical protein